MRKQILALGIANLLVATVLIGSIAFAFYTRLKSDGILLFGASVFFIVISVAMGFYFYKLTSLWKNANISLNRPSFGFRWMFVILVPLDIWAMGLACGGCTKICKILLVGAFLMLGLSIIEALYEKGAFIFLALCLFYAVPHCLCANPINRPWIEVIGYSPNCYAFSILGMTFAMLGLKGIWPRFSLLMASIPAGAAIAFGIGHKLFGYPW